MSNLVIRKTRNDNNGTFSINFNHGFDSVSSYTSEQGESLSDFESRIHSDLMETVSEYISLSRNTNIIIQDETADSIESAPVQEEVTAFEIAEELEKQMIEKGLDFANQDADEDTGELEPLRECAGYIEEYYSEGSTAEKVKQYLEDTQANYPDFFTERDLFYCPVCQHTSENYSSCSNSRCNER
jgi:hypothetical protein